MREKGERERRERRERGERERRERETALLEIFFRGKNPSEFQSRRKRATRRESGNPNNFFDYKRTSLLH